MDRNNTKNVNIGNKHQQMPVDVPRHLKANAGADVVVIERNIV